MDKWHKNFETEEHPTCKVSKHILAGSLLFRGSTSGNQEMLWPWGLRGKTCPANTDTSLYNIGKTLYDPRRDGIKWRWERQKMVDACDSHSTACERRSLTPSLWGASDSVQQPHKEFPFWHISLIKSHLLLRGFKSNEKKSKYRNMAFDWLLLGRWEFRLSAQRSNQLTASYCACASPSSEVPTLITNSVEQNNSWKLIITYAVRKLLSFYRTRTYYCAHKNQPVFPSLSQMTPIHSLPFSWFYMYINVIPPPTRRYSKIFLSFAPPPWALYALLFFLMRATCLPTVHLGYITLVISGEDCKWRIFWNYS